MTLELTTVTSLHALRALAPELWLLFEKDPHASPFQSPAWQLAWCECFCAPDALRALVLRQGGDLVGFLGLRGVERGGERVLEPIGAGLSDYIDALIDPAELRDVAPRLALEVRLLSGGEADRVSLSDLRESSPLLAELRNQGAVALGSAVCPRLSLPLPSLVDWRDSLRPWLRRNLQRTESALRARGTVTYSVAGARELSDRLEQFFSLHSACWKVRGQPGLLADPHVQRFHRLAAPELLARGLLRLYSIELDEQPIAMAYALERAEAALYLSGFDPRIERLSLGSSAIAVAVEQAHQRGYAVFDFLRGRERYKYAFGAVDSHTHAVTLCTRQASRPAAGGVNP